MQSGGGGRPILVMNQNASREQGRSAQRANITAAKAVADIVRTTLGPRSMLKMLLDPMGGIVMTNDGNCILREIDVSHPAAKSMLELSRAQEEQVGDGTTSVIILSGEMLAVAEPFLNKELHPTQIVQAYYKALDFALNRMAEVARVIDTNNEEEVTNVVRACVGTKFVSRWGDLMVDLALEAVKRITITNPNTGKKEIDIKRYARVEKMPGGEMSDCRVLNGVMLNKDVTHMKMQRRRENPRVLLMDCTLEYKKGESQTNIEIVNEDDWDQLLRQEEEYIERICNEIIAAKPDIVCTEKGISDLAQHYLVKAGITCLRRLRKTDNNRIARACGATICNQTSEIQESDIGTGCGLFEVRKIGEEYFSFFVECKDAKACTILLRGGSKDVLSEFERNLQDAMQVARNICQDPRLLPGGGATEMAMSQALIKHSKTIDGVQAWPFRAVGVAMEVIPRTLAQNCGADIVRVLTELRAKHAPGDTPNWGVDGATGICTDMADLKIWEPYCVKEQTIKTAIESAAMLLRIDDIVSGLSKKG